MDKSEHESLSGGMEELDERESLKITLKICWKTSKHIIITSIPSTGNTTLTNLTDALRMKDDVEGTASMNERNMEEVGYANTLKNRLVFVVQDTRSCCLSESEDHMTKLKTCSGVK